MKVLGIILGVVFILGCVVVLTINVIGLIKDIKARKNKKNKEVE